MGSFYSLFAHPLIAFVAEICCGLWLLCHGDAGKSLDLKQGGIQTRNRRVQNLQLHLDFL
jgi:hypothetical protein